MVEKGGKLVEGVLRAGKAQVDVVDRVILDLDEQGIDVLRLMSARAQTSLTVIDVSGFSVISSIMASRSAFFVN
mgnify:CR=1 FL=1